MAAEGRRTGRDVPMTADNEAPLTADVPTCDRCGRKLVNAQPALSERQLRFVDAYRQRLAIAPAARLARVHRATVYRWLADAAFTAAMRSAADAFFREHRAKVLAEEQTREQWRGQRERE